MPQAAVQRQHRQHARRELAIEAVEPRLRLDRRGDRRRGVGWNRREVAEPTVLALGAEGRLPALRDLGGALVLEPFGPAGAVEVERTGAARVEAVAVGAGARIGEAVGQPVAQQRHDQPGIAEPLLVEVDGGGVGGGRIDADPAVRIIAAQVEHRAAAEIDIDPGVATARGETVGLGCAAARRQRADAVGGEVEPRQAPAHRAALAADRRAGADRLARAGLDVEARLERPVGQGGDQVDHAADRLAAPQDRLRPAQDLDAGGVADGQVGEVVAAAGRGRVVHLDPVDHHHRLVGIGAADANAGERAEAAVAGEGHAGRADQEVGDDHRLAGVDRRFVDYRQRGRHFVGGDGHARGGNQDGFVRLIGEGGGGNQRESGNSGTANEFQHGQAPSTTTPQACSGRGSAGKARGIDPAHGTRTVLSSLGFTPVRPAHPVRAKDDRDGQVSWLAGQRRSGRLLGTWRPNGMWPMALRLQLQGQPGFSRSLFIPVSGEPVAKAPISALLHCVNRLALPRGCGRTW